MSDETTQTIASDPTISVEATATTNPGQTISPETISNLTPAVENHDPVIPGPSTETSPDTSHDDAKPAEPTLGAATPTDSQVKLPDTVKGEEQKTEPVAPVIPTPAVKAVAPTVEAKNPPAEAAKPPETPPVPEDEVFTLTTPHNTKKHPGGAPTVMVKETLQKLQKAFLMGCTDSEACLYADISMSTLYNYQNDHPEFLEKKDLWKDNPIMKARATVYNALDKPDSAAWYLERKARKEFATRHEVTGAEGGAVEVILDKMETNYDDIAKRAREAKDAATNPEPKAPGAAEGQVVAPDAPVQNQGQAGATSPVQT